MTSGCIYFKSGLLFRFPKAARLEEIRFNDFALLMSEQDTSLLF